MAILIIAHLQIIESLGRDVQVGEEGNWVIFTSALFLSTPKSSEIVASFVRGFKSKRSPWNHSY